ncbi:MAG: MFS transporter [Akkermansiaceae bacterium]|nr:MFS transporter [Akkermansiaceae bacterium]
MTPNRKACSTGAMCVYSLGECANSLVMNGIFAFAMLFYTKAHGIDPKWAGFIMSLAVFVEAVTEPIMGQISDNTRSSWGRRHPYMLAGGLLMALCYYLMWTIPAFCRGSHIWVFSYLVVVNLLLRAGLTMFFIPYLALGFEMCGDYHGRSRLQGIRQIANMVANFAGPAMAWVFFFGGKGNFQATTIEANYQHMGATFATATAVFTVLVVIFTFRWREDTRDSPRNSRSGWLRNFWFEMTEILNDPNPRWVFAFIFILTAGMVLVGSLQMFVYDDFMKFPSWQKSIAHGSTMVSMALGALLSIKLTQRFDKKSAVIIGGAISIAGNMILAALFLTDLVEPGATFICMGANVPSALILFVAFHTCYWFGCGIMLPVSTAMMADVSETRRLQTGKAKYGGYSSLFSLTMRLAISFSLILSSWCLSGIGYKVSEDGRAVTQTHQAVWGLGLVTFLVSALMCLVSLLAIRLYPISRDGCEGGSGFSLPRRDGSCGPRA